MSNSLVLRWLITCCPSAYGLKHSTEISGCLAVAFVALAGGRTTCNLLWKGLVSLWLSLS